MKEHPILFSAPMVKAILEGRKTQTRRVVKPQFKNLLAIYTDKSLETNCIFRHGDQRIHCPYGQVGSRLWVRETFVLESDLGWDIKLPTDRPIKTITDDYDNGEYHLIPHYRATEPEPNIVSEEQEDFDDRTRWKPSIFMPRWASRITLEITDIKVERLQSISKESVKAEGFDRLYSQFLLMSESKDCWNSSFFKTWEQINGNKKGYDWDSNPFVWVIEFKRI